MLQESWISLWHKIGKLLCWSDLPWQMEELMDRSLQTWLSSSVKWKRNTLDVISEGEGAQLATSCKGKPQGSCEMLQSWFRIWQCHKDIRWSTIAETNVSAPETLGPNLRDQLGPQWPIRAPLRGVSARHAGSSLHPCDDIVTGTYRKSLLCCYIHILPVVVGLWQVEDFHEDLWYWFLVS